jgi:hypothetical protein
MVMVENQLIKAHQTSKGVITENRLSSQFNKTNESFHNREKKIKVQLLGHSNPLQKCRREDAIRLTICAI